MAGTERAPGGIMTALARDVRGATLAIMCAALIPFCGMVGGGIDLARMYITKTRLQHACDAGVLAGRKQMGSGMWGADDNTAAVKFFDANYRDGAYGSTGRLRSFSESAGKVTGTASAVVPMTLMRVLGKTTETLSVTCDADMRLPNTDIMFVLDTTGSMAQKAVSTDTDTKIVSLKTAVKCFYEIVAKLDTDATCAAGAPSGGTGDQVQIRFGFMPYSTNVNVGKLVPSNYFVDKWTYPSRKAITRPVTTYTFDSPGNATVTDTDDAAPTYPDATSTWRDTTTRNIDDCRALKGTNNTPTFTGPESAPYSSTTTTSAAGDTQTTTYKTDQQYQYGRWYYYGTYNSGSGACKIYRTREAVFIRTRTYSRTDVGTPHTTQVFDRWQYTDIEYDVSKLKSGNDWLPGYSFNAPVGANGTDTPIAWDGCIEEAQTVSQASYATIPAGANDLNIDLKPSGTTQQWKPALPGLVFARQIPETAARTDGASYTNQQRTDFTNRWWDFTKVNTTKPVETTADYNSGGKYYCPTQATKLRTWTDANEFDTYVDSLNPTGNTYHDIGMIWGARFMSPDGIFGTENKLTSKGGEIERNMIFMTDGDAQASACDYSAYGMQFFGGRTTTSVGTAAECAGSQTATLTTQVEQRLEGLCTAVKNKNIVLWVISFGSGSNTATETRLSNCATPGRYFAARNSAQLQTTFASIANQISQLRLTQ